MNTLKKYWKHITVSSIGILTALVVLFTNVYKAVQAVNNKPTPAVVINNYYNKDIQDVQYAGNIVEKEDFSKAQTTNK